MGQQDRTLLPAILQQETFMIHAAFTIQGKVIHIILKNSAGRVIHHGMIRSERCDEVGEWLACKAAIREAGVHTRGPVRLYSDLAIVRKLTTLDPQYRRTEPMYWPEGWGPLPQIHEPTLYHFYDTLTMLWQLFNGKWEAVQTTQERILNNGH